MIFKPKVKQKIRQLLVRVPIFLLLALVCLVGHPARADAEEIETLARDMRYFISYKNYNITQTTGKNLNDMFHLTGKSKLIETEQYIAYYTVDKKTSSSRSWSTYYEYWHGTKWYKNNGSAKYNGHQIPEAPDRTTAHRRYGKDIIYEYSVNGGSKGDKDIGKASFSVSESV